MKPASFILTINAGSSSLKFALFGTGRSLRRFSSGKIERIGLPESVMTVMNGAGEREQRAVEAPDHETCVDLVAQWLQREVGAGKVRAVGHRIVHGGPTYSRPERVTPELLAELRRISPYDPEHLPFELGLIDTLGKRNPHLSQVACFDTGFHRDLPRTARLLPIPRHYGRMGIQRYGFHGLSYAFLMKELARVGRKGESKGRIILAHLGNGASMAAILNGKAIETTMSFTPASGLPMSSRSGDLDPGLAFFFARTEGMTAERFHHMVNAESGLLGVSETSSDVRDLLDRERTDPRAAEAIELFCYQAKKWIGALTVVLGGLDTLVFSGGIGENSPIVRARICQGLDFLGITVEPQRNEAGDQIISRPDGAVTVRVMRTDEEIEIATAVQHILG